MTKEEAVTRTAKGIWNNISKYITERIEDECDNGEFETRVCTSKLTDIDKIRLMLLGYKIELDDTDTFYHEYIISWH